MPVANIEDCCKSSSYFGSHFKDLKLKDHVNNFLWNFPAHRAIIPLDNGSHFGGRQWLAKHTDSLQTFKQLSH
jgi:hypothetical protein